MHNDIKFENVTINNSQVLGKNNTQINVNNKETFDWNKLDNILCERISELDPKSKDYFLAKSAKECVDKKDKKSLRNIVMQNMGEFSKNILCKLAAGELSMLIEQLLKK